MCVRYCTAELALFCGLPVDMCLRGMKRAAGCAGCRAEPGPGTGTDQGAGKDPSPAAGTADCPATHCSIFLEYSGSCAPLGGQLPCSALFWVILQPQHPLKLSQHHGASLCTVHCQCHLPQNSIFFPSLRTLHLVQSFPCHTGSGSASIGFQK